MSSWSSDEEFFATISDETEALASQGPGAPSRLKAKIYSALVRHQERTGPLASLSATKAGGRSLCIFEDLVQQAPVGERMKTLNICRVCHARILGEHVENAPIFWHHCPYVAFQKR
jgi:hypothetical protein